jgi:hypothetical protein
MTSEKTKLPEIPSTDPDGGLAHRGREASSPPGRNSLFALAINANLK